jgi:sulfur carrier protein ThiS
MPWHTLKDKAKILAIIRHLISRQRELKILIDGEKETFRARIVKLNRILSEKGEEVQLVIQRLDPKGDNELIRASSEVRMEFIVKKKFCKCKTAYIGPAYHEGDFVLLLAFPSSVQVHKERREERINLEMLEPISVKLTVGKELNEQKTYDLTVVDCSRHGLGLLVTQNAFDLLEELNVGDLIRDMIMYAPWALITVNGEVAHKTEFQEGDHKGCFMLGIKCRELITNGRIRKR